MPGSIHRGAASVHGDHGTDATPVPRPRPGMVRVADRRRNGFNEGHETTWIAIASWNGLRARISNATDRNKALVCALPAEWAIHLSQLLPTLVNAAVSARPGIATDLKAWEHQCRLLIGERYCGDGRWLNAGFATADQ